MESAWPRESWSEAEWSLHGRGRAGPRPYEAEGGKLRGARELEAVQGRGEASRGQGELACWRRRPYKVEGSKLRGARELEAVRGRTRSRGSKLRPRGAGLLETEAVRGRGEQAEGSSGAGGRMRPNGSHPPEERRQGPYNAEAELGSDLRRLRGSSGAVESLQESWSAAEGSLCWAQSCGGRGRRPSEADGSWEKVARGWEKV